MSVKQIGVNTIESAEKFGCPECGRKDAEISMCFELITARRIDKSHAEFEGFFSLCISCKHCNKLFSYTYDDETIGFDFQVVEELKR